MLLTLLSARKEERIRQKASEENAEEEDKDEVNFLVREAATRENMWWFLCWYPERGFLSLKWRFSRKADALFPQK